MTTATRHATPRPLDARRPAAALEIVLVFLVFFVHGAWAAPEVNEPHYLSKARHYWDPQFCPRDFFCNSADAHQVFYWTFGWVTRCLPLPAAAWIGRLVTWGALAWAWRRLSWALVPGRYYAVLSAVLFVLLNSRLHMAGEWVIGGVEAKGFAYVLVFLGLERLVRQRWGAAVVCFGAASALHVIVGGWAMLAAAMVWIAAEDRPPLSTLKWPLAVGLMLALPGLLPAVALTWGTPPDIVRAANRIYVFERLYHHLLPQRIPPVFIVRHLALVLALAALVRLAPVTRPFARLQAYVAATIAISLCGFALGLLVPLAPDAAAGLLRYYWFRLADVMVPLGASLVACAHLRRLELSLPHWHALALAATLAAAVVHLGDVMWRRGPDPRAPADFAIANLPAWRDACDWIARETPRDAVFLTPRLAQTFHWYAQRSEIANRKNIPQDAHGIVEWWRRNQRLYRARPGSPRVWNVSLAELGPRRLAALAAEFGAHYVVTEPYPPLDWPRVGPQSASVVIYRVPDETPPAEARSAVPYPSRAAFAFSGSGPADTIGPGFAPIQLLLSPPLCARCR